MGQQQCVAGARTALRGGAMKELSRLGFERIGQWRSETCRVHRTPWLRYRPGVYAFVVRGEVCYVGKADALHRRLRNYSNRCFGPGMRSQRHCHMKIAEAVRARQSVEVYALAAADPSEVEDRLIRRLRPRWN